jgi:hypothetical protein
MIARPTDRHKALGKEKPAGLDILRTWVLARFLVRGYARTQEKV